MARKLEYILLLGATMLLFSCSTTKAPVTSTVTSTRSALSSTESMVAPSIAPITRIEKTEPIETKEDQVTATAETKVEEPKETAPAAPVKVEETKEEVPTKTEKPVKDPAKSPVVTIIPAGSTEPIVIAPTKTEPKAEPTTVKVEGPQEEPKLEPAVTMETTKKTPFKEVDRSDVISLFNYAYGIQTMEELRAEDTCFVASYFARGIYDAVADTASPTLLAPNMIQEAIDDYVVEYFYEGKTFGFGDRPETHEDIMELTEPTTIPEKFSYAYAYDYVRDLIYSEVDMAADEFIQGTMDVLYNSERLLDDYGVQTAVNAYIEMLNEAYYLEIANAAENNKVKAEAFLSENAKRDEVTVLPNGIQIEILGEDEYLGSRPAQYDRVLLDYNMYTLDYDSEELMMIDADWGAEIALMNAEPSLRESVVAMRVGQAARTYIPPEMGYGEVGATDIEPNAVIVYDIALNGIL